MISLIFKIVARELEVLAVDSPEENTEDNTDLTEREEVGAEDTVNVTHAILKSAILSEQIADYKLKVGALEFEIAKLKEELSKKAS